MHIRFQNLCTKLPKCKNAKNEKKRKKYEKKIIQKDKISNICTKKYSLHYARNNISKPNTQKNANKLLKKRRGCIPFYICCQPISGKYNFSNAINSYAVGDCEFPATESIIINGRVDGKLAYECGFEMIEISNSGFY